MATDTTTIAITKQTRDRLNDRKPFDSTTYDELINELLDATETNPDIIGRF